MDVSSQGRLCFVLFFRSEYELYKMCSKSDVR